jgi:nucleoid-associated protein YgaU
VAPGDNLWTIARDRLAEVTGRPAAELGEREVARYWLQVVDANRATLRSGDPDLIFPGETIKLPPVTRQER